MTRNYFTLKFYALFACIFFAGIFALTAQVKKDFEVRFEADIKGDIIFIGNNILNREEGDWTGKGRNRRWVTTTSANEPYNLIGNASLHNDFLNMQYIDVDNDETTFSSSSATLTIPDENCSRIVHAALYWTAKYPYEARDENGEIKDRSRHDFSKIKFKTPGDGYIDISSDEIIYDGFNNDISEDAPYTCFKDITDIIRNLSTVSGEYTVANIRAAKGLLSGYGGGAAGWSIVVVYENPLLPQKYITTFDGFAGIQKNDDPVDIEVKGFKTLPEPYPVHANMIASTLEGDNKIDGDKLSISAENNLSFFDLGTNTTINNKNNFFDSNITLNNQIITDRNPNSVNTLGFDTDKFKVPNSGNSVIPNNATQAKLRLSTDGDTYYVYFASFDVEIIGPNIKLVKGVFDKAGKDIQGDTLELGKDLQYTLTFDNIGNDNGTGFTIRDVLPLNVDLVNVILPPATANEQPITYTYDYETNEIRFSIPDEYVIKERGGSKAVTIEEDYTIRINVKVQEDCDKLRDACSNIVKNLAYASYQGVLNDYQHTNDPSILGLTACLFEKPGATNFLPELTECGSFERAIDMCGEYVDLTAGANYDRYQWFELNDAGVFVEIPGETNQTYRTAVPGTFKVEKETDADDCKDFEEIITVNIRGTDNTSPFALDADELVTCSNDGSILPKFYLCGTNDDKNLTVNFPEAELLSWQKLDEACEHVSESDDCPTKDNSCTWHVLLEGKTESNFLLSGPGEYRLEVRYQNGCFNRFYFKAYENSLDPQVTDKDMACGKPGRIDITNAGEGYEYAIGFGEDEYKADELTWQAEPTFEVTTPGIYGVYIRQSGVEIGEGDREPCLFRGRDAIIQDLQFGFSANAIAPLCFDGKGSIAVSINGALPQYSFWLKDTDGNIIEEHLASQDNFYQFEGQSPGTYIVEVETVDGCSDRKTVVIPNGEELDFTATPHDIACDDGSVTLNIVDGEGEYSYAVWSYTPNEGATAPAINYNNFDDIPASAYFTDENYIVSEGSQGVYVFMVTNINGCKILSNEVTVNNNPPIEWTLSGTDLSCFQSNDGVIMVNHGATNGYTLTYQLIDLNGNPINSENGQFNNLSAGRNYKVIVTQTYGDQSCSTEDVITLTEPDRLTASAGVSKLPGCNDSDIELAEVRITNPLGGTPPYRYSFDGINYGSSAIGYLKADTHTIYIMDEADCTFAMEVVIPDLPEIPTAEVSYTYNCDGTGNVIVIPSIPDYEYTYDINGTPVTGDFTDGFNYDDLAPGEHTVTVHYNNPNYATYSNLLNEDFGRGDNTTSPYIDPVYCYESQYANDQSECEKFGEFNREINDGEYSVTSKIDPGKELFVGWISPIDHTNPTEPGGRYMAINIGGVAGVGGVIFKKRVFDVIPHQKISVELEAFNLIGEGTNNRKDPYLTIQLVGTDGVVINEIDTEQIPRHTDAHSWINYAVELNPENNDELDIVIRTQSEEESGNDIAIDDILAYQIPEKCDLTLEVPIEIESKPFGAKIDGVTDALCSGADNGEIEVAVSNFDPTQGFQYSIDNGTTWSTVITESPFTISGLKAGAYEILVRDVRDTENCVQELEQTIEDPSPLDLFAEVTTPMSCSNNFTAIITVTAEGGSGTFEYRLVGENGYVVDFQSERIFTVVGLDKIGNYTISVKDENGCTSPTEATVELVAPLEVDIDLDTDICISENGNIYVNVTDGNGDYQFSLDNINWEHPDPSTPSSFTFDGLVPGLAYTVYVKDGMGCPDSETITLKEPISITADTQTSITCFDSADGSLTIDVHNFETSYTYSLDGIEEGSTHTQSSLLIENIPSGSHTVVITDQNGCTVSHDFEIDAPPAALEASYTTTEITCISDGSVTISASHGWGSYTYELTSTDGTVSLGPQSEATFTGLSEGNYEVIVRDAGGCPVPVTFELKEPELPEVTLVAATSLCNSEDGVVLVANASKGKSPYQYQLNGGEKQSSNEFTVYTAGDYTVTVTDANGCTFTSETAVQIKEELQVSATLTKDLDCNDPNDAVITLNITGGYPTYSMDVLKDGVSFDTDVSVSNGATYQTTEAGKYSFIITDSEGCTDTTNIVEVTQKTPPTIKVISVDPLCFGGSNGSIELILSGGFPPYTIDLNGSTASKIGGLSAGTYNYTVTDSKGCSFSDSVTLTDPIKLDPGTIDLVEDYRCDNSSATIELTGYSGGTANSISEYEFSLDNVNYQPSPRFSTNILPGDYTIYIRDINDCVASEDITIDPLNKPSKLNFTGTDLTCPDLNSDVTVTVEGGNAPFNYEIIAPSGSVVDNQQSNIFENLTVGTYTFRITDAKGCTIDDTYTVEKISQITLDTETKVTRVCIGESTGSISVFVSDFNTSYSYTFKDENEGIIETKINQNTTTQSFTGLGEGSYTLTVTDETTNCTATEKVTIEEPTASLDLELEYTPVTCLVNGSITATAKDGWGGYAYQLENQTGVIITEYQTSNIFNNVTAGDYVVRVKDEMGCVATDNIKLEGATPPTINVVADEGFCFDGTEASLVVNVTGGHAPFRYKVNGGEVKDVTTLTDGKFTISGLTPGNYTIVVYDNYGCEATAVTETINSQLVANSVVSKTLDCTINPNAQIEVEITGGYSPYTYVVRHDGGAWSDPSTPITNATFTYDPSTAGTYTFKITDGKGCTTITEKEVAPIVLPEISQIVVTDATCFDSATGALDVQIDQTKGVSPYTIEVFENNGGVRGTSLGNQTTNLPAGDYIIEVTDAKNCKVEDFATIGQPEELDTKIHEEPLQCVTGEGIKLGSLEVTIDSGGTGDFTVALYDKNDALVITDPNNNPRIGVSLGTTVIFDELNYGDYTIRIVDANGCETIEEATINAYTDIILELGGQAGCELGTGIMEVEANNSDPEAPIGTGDFYFAIYPYAAPFDPNNPTANGWHPGEGDGNRFYTFTDLDPGVTYTFVVYDKDTNCEFIQEGTIPVPFQSDIESSVDVIHNVTCKGLKDGYADFTVTGFDSGAKAINFQVYNAYDYTAVLGGNGSIPIPGGATFVSGSTLMNLPPGEYYIMFTEVGGANNLCVKPSEPFRIRESFENLALAVSTTNDNCAANAGTITATATFGTPPYEYQFLLASETAPIASDPNWIPSSVFNGESGDYIVYVKDANNCIVPLQAIIDLDPSPEIELSVTNQCDGNSGSFGVEVKLTKEGIAPYLISIDGNPFVSASDLENLNDTFNIVALAAGKHTIAIKDANGCEYPVQVDIFAPLSSQAVITTEVFCDPADQGVIDVNVTGGSGNFTYAITTANGNTSGDVSGSYTGLAAGEYEIEITDVTTGCTDTAKATLTQPEKPVFKLEKTDVSCHGGNDGTIRVVMDPSSVDGPYTYSINNATPISTPEFNSLTIGEYTITVISAKGCISEDKIEITEPAALAVDLSASEYKCEHNYSVIKAEVHPTLIGTPPYTYSFDGAEFQNENFIHVPYGSASVSVIVRDANGCLATDLVEVPEVINLNASITVTQEIECLKNEQLINITIEGSGNYTITQLPGDIPVTQLTDIPLTEPGTYTYKVVDNITNCTVIKTHVIDPYDMMNITASVTGKETCSDSSDGKIGVTITGYKGSFSYAVFNQGGLVYTSPTLLNADFDPFTFETPGTFDQGIYYVEVTQKDFPYCFAKSNTVTIQGPDPIEVELISNVNANCDITTSTVTVHASGGTPPYLYAAVPVSSAAPVDGEYTASNEFNLDPVTSTWDVYVLDANGCVIIEPLEFEIDKDPTPEISLSINDECVQENEFEVKVNLDAVGVEPYQISVDGGAPQQVSSFPITLTGLSSGKHAITITDANGCGETEPIEILKPLELTVAVGQQPSCTLGGVINFDASGGSDSSNYLPELLRSDGTPTLIPLTIDRFEDVPAGDYLVSITDTETNCSIQLPVSLEEATPVVFELAKVDVSCHDGSNGSIIVQLDTSNNQPPYTYQLVQLDGENGNAISGTEVTQTGGNTIFTGLPGGFYRVTVTSDRGCIASDEIEIVNPPALGISIELYGNCTSPDGYALQVNLTDIGTSPYKLKVNGKLQNVVFDANQKAVIDHLSAGNYEVEIIDANGCSFTATDKVNIVPLNFNRSLTTLLDCEDDINGNGAITLSDITGSGDYHFTITDPNGVSHQGSFSTPEFEWTEVTMPGVYTISLTDDAAASECGVIKTIAVPEKLHPDFKLTGFDAKCYGVDNGSIYASAIDNGTGPYVFEIIEIGGNPITPIPSDDPTPGYEATFSSLEGSDLGLKYVVRATSTTNACDSEVDIQLSQATPITGFSASVTQFECAAFNNGNNAMVTVTPPTGGSGNYRYVFVYDNGTPGDTSDDKTQNSTRTEFIVSNAVGGSVSASVIDGNGCAGTSVDLTVEPYVEFQEIGTQVTQPTCHGNDGSVLVDVTLVNSVVGIDNDKIRYDIESVDGTYSDTQTLDSNDATPLDYLFENLAIGGYRITVTNESTKCQISTTVLLNDPNTFDVEVTKIQDVICYGTDSGIVDVNLVDPSYTGTYNWTIYNSVDHTEVKIGNQTDNTGINLYAGSYYVEITQEDVPYCVNQSYFTINQSDKPLTIDAKVSKSISCTDPGEITVTASGGYGFYEFKVVDKLSGTIIQDWSDQNVFTSISEGTYEVFVRDDKGCDQVSQDLTLIQPVQITAEAIQGDVIYCDGEMTASIEVINVTGGRPAVDPTLGYLYVLNLLDSDGNIISSTSAQTNPIFTGLQAGSYSVKVFDNFGCDVLTNAVVIGEPDQVVASLRLLKGNTCTTGATLELTAEGGTGTGYQYSTSANGPWISFGGSNTVQIDVPGVVTSEQILKYYVRDSNLCISSVSNTVTLSPIRPLEITPTVVSDVSCFGDATGYIKVDVKGGLGNYKYTLIDGIRNVVLVDKQDGNTFNNLTAGVYYVQVDSEDCSEQVRVAIEQGKELTAKTPVVFNPVCTDDLGRIEVGLEGGTGEYQYAISPNLDQFQSKNVFEDLTPGTYTIIAQDSRGCNPFVFKQEIIAPPPLEAKANILNEEFCIGDSTGSFELIIQGGTPPYSTAINTQDDDAFEQDRKVFNGLKGGETYVVFIRDANGCQQNVLVSLKDPVNLNPRADVRVTCISNSAANEVEITLAQEGLVDVIYTLDGGADQFDNKFTNVAPGDHTVTVSYAGCERVVEFTVDPVQPLALTVNESNLNEFTMYPSGGSAPYEYFIDGVSQGSESSYKIKVSGVYQVMIVDANGCQQIAQIDMEFIDIKIPNVFTPNGDGENDYWPPSNYGVYYPNLVTKIYDRYGRVVAELRKGTTWDGRYNGTELPTGDYWYVMKLNEPGDDREFVGHFTLYR